jgi:hypothetical protein
LKKFPTLRSHTFDVGLFQSDGSLLSVVSVNLEGNSTKLAITPEIAS